MNGPTMRFSIAGNARRTEKLSPRSRGFGSMREHDGGARRHIGWRSSPGRMLMLQCRRAIRA